MANYTYHPITPPTQALGRSREIWVYLPTNYADSTERFPVIYLHDGQNLTEHRTMGSDDKWQLEQFLAQNQHFILVSIDCIGEHRLNEYAPFPAEPEAQALLDSLPFPHAPFHPEGDRYIAWLVDDLKPYIDHTYRTDPTRNGIIGSSMGALISLYAQATHPHLFTYSALLSPAYWFSPTQLMRYLQSSHLNHQNIIYTSVGDAEQGLADAPMYLEPFAQINHILHQEKQTSLTARIISQGKHHETDWAKLIPEIFAPFIAH
ncbi:alpha/beta hydrolase [Entomospira culicis]|uniref:Alpha/beta hydrolase n=1 Tax=Entomospira culicis TaxID=2719989 RepID=A0A968GLP5_9SPIO|nr:alpha/beta hydrolase-fold protein [Entomospira culicis]NIZ19876.1 alpha/beta hydrolase [Entomospira culicis]NIZ70090.1 alpha/beta hydrolase [Entomospira culicis]WDI37194.1 alpha/beta hydrolase-fold protein [Entomospira culicis]WDI38823.1 alpha/beta hydrolase-fold protein [Entomospira culicis]